MQTILNLLTRDGVVYMAFCPSLSAHQYAQLIDLSHEATSADQLRELVDRWAADEGVTVSFDELRGVYWRK